MKAIPADTVLVLHDIILDPQRKMIRKNGGPLISELVSGESRCVGGEQISGDIVNSSVMNL